MNYNLKFIGKMVRIYGLVVVFANIIAVYIPSTISIPVFNPQNVQKWESFLQQNLFAKFAIFIAFLIPTIFCIVYSERIFKSEETALKNLAEIPSVFSLSSVIGWNMYFFIEIPFVFYAHVKHGILMKSILITSWAFDLFAGMTAWTISYLAIEVLNRMILLPRIFPEGHIQNKKGFSFRPSFKHLLIFCFMVSSVFPVVLLLTSLIAVQLNNNLELNTGLIIISMLLLSLALLITLALTRIILNPLNSLTQAAKKIKEGDYKSKVRIVSADELGVLADSFNDMADSLAEKEFMRDTFGKVVDPEVRDYLMKNGDLQKQSLGGETREVTVLFCDIRSFTAMSEKLEASQVVTLLNTYFTALGKCITKHHGIINKYIGDAIMAIFGAPVESQNSALDAYEAAIDMRKELVEVNKMLIASGFSELRFGIGIHTGPVFAGTIGASNRMEYTVIGDTVNTASRLESLCKTYSTDFLISESAVIKAGLSGQNEHSDQAEKSGTLKFVDNAQIRGKAEPMKIYTC